MKIQLITLPRLFIYLMSGIRTILVIAVIIGILLLVKYFFIPTPQTNVLNQGQGNAPALPVSAIIARASGLSMEVFATGSLVANEEVDLHPEVSGRILEILFTEGSKVNKGALLVKINDADLQAALRKVELDKKLADDRVKRNEKLMEMKGISQEEYDGLVNASAVLNAERDVLLAQIAKTEIRAPFNGIIGLKTVSEGSYVSPQTMIASIQQIDPLKIDFSIPEKYAAIVKNGDEISFISESENVKTKGKIYAVEPKVDIATRSVRIRAICPNANAELRPGAFVSIALNLGEQSNVLMVPTNAIIPILKGKQVFVYRDGIAEPVKVETGLRNDSTIQIKSGLNENDTVITTGIMSLRPGVPVKLISVK